MINAINDLASTARSLATICEEVAKKLRIVAAELSNVSSVAQHAEKLKDDAADIRREIDNL